MRNDTEYRVRILMLLSALHSIGFLIVALGFALIEQ